MKKAMLTGALMLTAAMAQEPRRMEYHTMQTVTGAGSVAFQGMPFVYERSEMVLDGGSVKGAPYSADAITETTQTLADGNRIHRTTKAALYRDSLGRTRHEQTLGELGPLTAAGEPIQTIMINDPVAGTHYVLNSREKVAHKMQTVSETRVREDGAGRGAEADAKAKLKVKLKAEAEFSQAGIAVATTGAGNMTYVQMNRSGSAEERKNIKSESLGPQIIEGVSADGTRTTMTIPAGKIGNEQPIQVVTETWYSPQLHTTVMTKTTDPRMGETVYKLTNVKLIEPDPSLFAPPADYTVQ